MSGDITDFFVHTLTVATFDGAGAFGPVYGTPETVTGYLDGKTQLVRSLTGEQVVSQSSFYCTVADSAKFTPDSKVTTADGRAQQVISVNTLDAAGTMPGVEHAVIYLQ